MLKLNDNNNNLTEGSITKKLILFSLPLLIGNLLQQVYYISDSVIVGKFLGKEALAAVGNASAITVIMVQFFMGIAGGTGILIAQYVGARNFKKLNNAIKASVLFNIVFGLIISITGIIFADWVLAAMETPYDVFFQTKAYLIVSFGGMLPMLMYNMGASSMQALGNSKTPLYFLSISSFVNIVLDLFFILKLNMGVEGTALATCIAQLVAAVLVYVFLYKEVKQISLDSKVTELNGSESYVDRKILKRILYLGLPIGIQGVVINFSNLVVQSHINSLGSVVMAAWSIFCRVDGFILLPISSFYLAVMTFTGQNYGGKKPDRIVSGLKKSVVMCVCCTVFAGTLMLMFAEPCFGLFTKDRAVVEIACSMAWHLVPFYFMLAMQRCMVGTISGIGDSIMPMIINFTFMCVYRLISIPTFTAIMGRNMNVIYLTYLSSWTLSFLSVGAYYLKKTRKEIKKCGIV